LDELDSDELRQGLSDRAEDSGLSLLERGMTPETIQRNFIDGLSDAAFDMAQNAETIEKIDALRRAFGLRNEVLSRNSCVSVPIKINGRLTEIDMYVINGQLSAKNGINIYMALDTGTSLGKVQAYITADGKTASVKLSADGGRAVSAMSEEREALVEFIREAGFTAGEIDFEITEGRNLFSEAVKGEFA
jgi:hypothetical protein